jgi:transcriptional regulator with XRE-family HTH domain
MSVADYAVKITIKNGRILSRMRARGIKTLRELARKAGIPYGTLCSIVALKKRPVGVRGEWVTGVENVAGVLMCDVDDLFTDAQREMEIERNSGEVYMDEPEVVALTSGDPERAYWIKSEAQRLLAAIPSERSRSVVMRCLDGETFAEIAEDLGVSSSRVQQIRDKAFLRMKATALRTPGRGPGDMSVGGFES